MVYILKELTLGKAVKPSGLSAVVTVALVMYPKQ